MSPSYGSKVLNLTAPGVAFSGWIEQAIRDAWKVRRVRTDICLVDAVTLEGEKPWTG